MNAVRNLAVCTFAGVLALSAVLSRRNLEAQPAAEKRPSLKEVQDGARGGDPKMQNELGLRYLRAEDKLPRDFAQAAQWFQRAADRGLPAAQHNLAGLFYYGTGIPQSYEEALKWYRKAAEAGFSPSQSFLGWMYLHGKGVEQNIDEALKWYRKGAEQGDREAQFSLGQMYYTGENLKPDFIESYKWINLAAAQGHTNAIKQRARLAEALKPEELTEAQRRSAQFKPAK